MKKLTLILFFQIALFSSTTMSAQTESFAGTYSLFPINNEIIKRTLVLKSNGDFEFHSLEFHENGIPKEKKYYAKGNWVSNKNVILFSVNESDINEKFTLDFNNTKARFHTKSLRDKSNRDIKTTLRFYESEVFWIKGMKLTKHIN